MLPMAAQNNVETEVSHHFAHKDADIVLRSSPQTKSQSTVSILFRMHKCNLTRYSAVFRDMFELDIPKEQDSPTDGSLPEVQLAETATALNIFLSFFEDDIARHRNPQTLDFEQLIRLWEMADKYQAVLISQIAVLELR